MASSSASAANVEEVAALDRLLFRLVMTPEERMGAAIQEHLPPLLDRLGTADAGIRNKVLRMYACMYERVVRMRQST